MTALGLFASSWVAEETKTIKTLGSASKQKQKKTPTTEHIHIPCSLVRHSHSFFLV